MSLLSYDYVPGSEPVVEAQIAEGSVVVGRVVVFKRFANNLCFVRSSRLPCDVIVNSAELRGAAQHTDVVAVELLPPEQWQPVVSTAKEAEVSEATEAAADVALQTKTIEDGLVSQVPEAMPMELPDGRRITQLIAPETSAEIAQNASAEVTLAERFHAPTVFNWPPDVRPTGRVVCILKRRLPLYHVARFAENQLQVGQVLRTDYFYRFRPFNQLYPQLAVHGRDILSTYQPNIDSSLFSLELLQDAQGQLSVPSRMPAALLCKIHSFLGDAASVEAVNHAICTASDVRNEPFSEEAEACVPAEFAMPSAEELAVSRRRDLRETEFVCTIDPATARDLDDALSIRRRRDGGFHVGVHIADVSHFVQPGTALDEEAQLRSTSVYLVDRVIPMLPSRLSEHYCSLNPNEDKFAFSALFEFDREGTLISEAATGEKCEWFGQSVIRSRCRLAYEQAQQILNDDDTVELDVAGTAAYMQCSEEKARSLVKQSVKDLFKVAGKLRQRSFQDGRLVLGNSRLVFNFDRNIVNAPPTSFFVQKQIEANWVVEEFMLFANERVAQKVVQFIPNGALLRRHKAPSSQKMAHFRAALAKHGLPVGGSTGQELQRVLDIIKKDHADAYYTVCELLKYSLMAAEYLANDPKQKDVRSHYAVAAPWYTHFTSPIRRYCDLMVHRQLQVALELEARMEAEKMEMPAAPDPSVETKPGEEVFDAVHVIDVDTLRTRALHYAQSHVEMIVTHANECRLNARTAGDMSLEYFLCLYLLALQKRAKEDVTLPQVLATSATIVKMTDGSFVLFSAELATEVEVGFKDTEQRFAMQDMIVTNEANADGKADATERSAGGQEKTINLKAKAHARKKGGKSDMPSAGGAGASEKPCQDTMANLAASVTWGVAPKDGQPHRAPPQHQPPPQLQTAAVAAEAEEAKPVDDSAEETVEVFTLFTEVVTLLNVVVKSGRPCLKMVVLPPWEREAARQACPTIPRSLVEEA